MHYSQWIKGAPLALAATTTLAATVPQDLTELTGSEAAALVCARTVTSRQLVEAFLARIDSHRQLNAFIAVDAKLALAQADAYDQRLARGDACLPLGGVPIGIKDNIQVKGFANSAGTPALKGFYPASSAPVVERLQAAGAIIVGKTNMHELAFGSSGYNTAFHVPGTVGVRNAYDSSRIAGGSSSGSGSAVGARLVPLALGTDTGGSVRQPCALNGCVGLRPTVGRYSQHGITPISPTRDTAGPMARSVEDVILLDRVITGEQPVAAPTPGQIRLGVVSEFWTDLAPEVEQQARAALAQLQQAGVTLVPVALPGIHELNARISMPIALYEGRDALQAWLRDQHTGVSLEELARQISGPDVKGLFEHFIMPRKLPHPDGQVTDLTPAYRWAIDTGRPRLIQQYRTLLNGQKLDALVFPTTPELAIPSNPQATSFDAFARMIRNTDPGSNAGLPGISLPIGLAGTPALPVGLELDGLPGSDARLLAIARTLQSLLGRPALSRN